MLMPKIYLGTGGYSDTDLIGTLYPHGTSKTDFLNIYSRHYDTIEINSTFHAPIGEKALQGMTEKAEDRLKFSAKLHQDFSHQRTANEAQAKLFLNALQPLIERNCLANLFVQFPHTFERTTANRLYLAQLTKWFNGFPLAIEFRHNSWHISTVKQAFAKQPNLIWCNVDYPANIGLPPFHFYSNQKIAYLRLHGRNPNWWKAETAQQRHDYRYSDPELQQLANLLHQHHSSFEQLYIYFQNTTNNHSFYNIATLKGYLAELNFEVKTEIDKTAGEQGVLF
ncbi:DUF72 domain-containing protein [Actinobacillus lignieresii]|uniref:DUF72 domain-containing protein n=1 Tax=Actinobacillus lignieresii TaxID=720 RepID=UPI000E1FE1A2|nr:DUF72 domain-containing protein [Actinobacillus lignieresii]